MNGHDQIIFVPPWEALQTEGERLGLQRQLQLEVTPGHPLWGRNAQVVGRSGANDDVVATTSDGGFAIVHLVWESSPGDEKCPATSFFSTVRELSDAMRAWSIEAGFLDD